MKYIKIKIDVIGASLTIVKNLLPLLIIAGAMSGCSKECKSTAECSSGLVCKNGSCSEPDFTFDTDKKDTSKDTGDTDSNTDTSTNTDTVTDTKDTGDTDSSTSSDSSSDSDTSDSDTGLVSCTQNWECNDDNMCTSDLCSGGVCSYSQTTPVPEGCCSQNSDCNDNDSCTTDSCRLTDWTCTNDFAPGDTCCLTDAHCDDGNSCTTDVCTQDKTCQHVADNITGGCCNTKYDCKTSSCADIDCVDNSCVYTPVSPLPSECCNSDNDCGDDLNPCTKSVCSELKICSDVPDASLGAQCCVNNSDCEDYNSCTEDVCAFDNNCVFASALPLLTGCCSNDNDCYDGDSCTADKCENSVCVYSSPATLPNGCCADAGDCDDYNDCTREVCDDGHCISNVDKTLGPQCCVAATDCADGDACNSDACDSWDNHCYYTAPDSGSLAAGCCAVNADCVDSDEPDCNLGTCGITNKWKCDYTPLDGTLDCNDGLYCNGAEMCSSGVCVTDTDANICAKDDTLCRVKSCDEGQDKCVVSIEYDTDVTCDDGLFCNGDEVCQSGDCVHKNVPCADTDTGNECALASCDEDNDVCGTINAPDNFSCTSADVCEGQSVCLQGTCAAGDACGGGNDCLYYTCDVDINGFPECTPHYVSNGTSCTTPDYGLCFGSADRVCLDGICSIGSNPMCNATDGFCADYTCVSEWGPTAGCVADTLNYSFNTLSCTRTDTDTNVDTDTTAPSNVAEFNTALEHNKADNYGSCGTGFTGGDIIYKIEVKEGDSISAAVSNISSAVNSDVYIMILEDACDPTSCISAQIGSNSYTATAASNGDLYVVIDMKNGAIASGDITLNLTCL